MNTKEKTLEDVSPEAFGLIMALNEKPMQSWLSLILSEFSPPQKIMRPAL